MNIKPVDILWHLDNPRKLEKGVKYTTPLDLQILDQNCIRSFVKSESDLNKANKILSSTLDLIGCKGLFKRTVYYQPPIIDVGEAFSGPSWILADLSGWDGESYTTVQVTFDPFSYDRSIKIQDMNLFANKLVNCRTLIKDKIYIGPSSVSNELVFTSDCECRSLGNLSTCKSLYLLDCNDLEDASNLKLITNRFHIDGNTQIKSFPRLTGLIKMVGLKNTNINVLCFPNSRWKDFKLNEEASPSSYFFNFYSEEKEPFYVHKRFVKGILKSPLEDLPIIINQCKYQVERDMVLTRLNGLPIWPNE